MICLSFLVTFRKPEPEANAKISSKSDKGKKKETPAKKGKTGPKTEQAKDASTEKDQERPLDPGFVDCSQYVKCSCRVEYTLFDGFVYGVDVNCWGPAAKIYTDRETVSVRCVESEDKHTVCFTIWHGYKLTGQIDGNMISNMSNTTIAFKFNENRNVFSATSRNDNPKMFYDFARAADGDGERKKNHYEFGTVFETRPGVVPERTDPRRVSFADIERELPDCPTKFLTRLSPSPCSLHRKILYRLIGEYEEKLSDRAKELKEEEEERQKQEDAMKEKEVKVKGKKRPAPQVVRAKPIPVNPNDCIIGFKGDQLLIERTYDYHEKLNLTSNIAYAAVVYSVRDLLPPQVKEALIPFTIIIKKLYNLPPPDDKITKLFLTYKIEAITKDFVETNKVTLKNCSKVAFNHSDMCFMNNIKISGVIENLQTGRLLLQLYGICKKEKKGAGRVYGQCEADNSVGRRHRDRYNKALPLDRKGGSEKKAMQDGGEVRLLANAAHDLSQAVKTTSWIRLYCSLSSRPIHELNAVAPDYADIEEQAMWWQEKSHSALNPLDINTARTPETEPTYFNGGQLNTYGSMIKVMVKVDVQLEPVLLSESLNAQENHSRLVAVIYNKDIAAKILARLMQVNEHISGSEKARATSISMATLTDLGDAEASPASPEPTKLYNYRASFEPIENRSSQSITTSIGSSSISNTGLKLCSESLYVSGFIIDCVDESIMMVEGLSNTTFPRILSHIYRLHPRDAKVLYNSDLVFCKRYYKALLQQKKIYVITMAEPISKVLSSYHSYLEGNIPIPAWKALLKLDFIRKSCTIDAVCKNNLLPTTDELLSFDLEFGIPIDITAIVPSTKPYVRLKKL